MSRDDQELFGALRELWQERDPMPPGLVDDVLVALGTRRLAEEYRELLLVSDERTLAGARGGAPRVLEFGVDPVTLLLRIESDAGTHRIDGWLAPPRSGRASLETAGHEVAATDISPEGRFEFAGLAPGGYRLVIRPDGSEGYSVTGEFEVR
ncbi:hypothetical protein [Protaetiibacter mangrovi]|uniref:Carboxypeptidase regulatory-like domain-containing protein n=1 Tax=Protaetiibacter mangrovi TaxID=2970926 RepID=A0ABT1ZG83_9MICO|nr:hypothetical protein [Protaetiibacter mangrovi]MCS0499716.1 hypothetical protein [Protaetiibacter mangrovi]